MDIHKLCEPLNYTLNHKGKNIRKHLILYIQYLLGNKNPYISQIINDINVTHNATLIIDDIHDQSLKRRGKTCAYLLFGKPLTLNAGYLKTLQILDNLDTHYPKTALDEIRKLYINSFYKGHIGQGFDIYWREINYIPSLKEYIIMVDNKTGIIFNTSVKICNLCNDIRTSKERLEKILIMMTYIGRFFQIRDDYINLTCPKYWKLKGFCEDLDHNNVNYTLVILKHIYPQYTLVDTKEKIYRILYKKNIFTCVWHILDKYREKIILLEKEITQSDSITHYLDDFFKKLTFEKALHYNKLSGDIN
tara:strand:- start:2664 stop:3578 length:915 start_codon:yes stop_codon:yes gene_type:complete